MSALNSPFTAISFSFAEKLIFDIGFLAPLALVDYFVGMNFLRHRGVVRRFIS